MATVTHAATAVWTTTAGNKTVTATPAVGDLIIVVAADTSSGHPTTAVTDNNSDGLGTYTKVDTDRTGFSTGGDLSVWVRNALVGSASSTVFTAAQATSTGGGLDVYRVSGMYYTGARAVRSAGGQSTGTAGTTPAPVLSNTPLTSNVIISAVCNGTSPGGVTASSTFTRPTTLGYATPTTGLCTEYVNSGITSSTITWGGTSATAFASTAIELDTSSPETAPGLELSTFGSFSGVVSGDTINYVQVDITHKETSATDPPPTAQLWNGTTAQIGSTATLTSGTSLHDDSFQITGVTYSELGTLQVRFYPSAPSGDGAHVDSVGLTVNYAPQPSVDGETAVIPNIGVAANLVVPFNSVTGQTAFVWLAIPVGTSAQSWSENVSTAITPVRGVTATVVVGSSAISGTAAFAATATLSAAASLALPGSATFAGTANLTAAGTVQLPGTSTFHGTATLSAAAAIVLPGTATLAGTATMSATAGALTIPGTAALSASANFGATGAVQISGTASLTGTAAMTASGVVVLGGAANFGAVAILSASGSIGGVIGGTASFSASASLTAAGTIYLPGSASLSASAVLSAPATVQLPGTASLHASAVLSAAAVVNLSGSAAFIANAILSASGSIGSALSGTATFTAAAQMSASASLILPGTAALSATATLSAAGYLGIPGTASFTANAVMTAAGYLNGVISGAAVFTANAVLQTNGVVILPATADFSATAELSAAGQVMLHGMAAFIANAVMTATGEFPGIATPGVVSVVFSQVTVVTATVDQVTSLKEA